MSQINFLTDDFINDLLGDTRVRGGYEAFLRKFAASGEKYIDVRSDATFGSKKTASLLNSFTQNAKKLMQEDGFPKLRVVKTKDDSTVIVVNMDVYAASQDSDESDEGEE
jgi:hypothetical protein